MVRSSGHGGQQGSESGIPAEYFEHHEALVRSSAGPQAVGHGNGARHAGAEANTVVGAGNNRCPWSWEWPPPSRLPDKGARHNSTRHPRQSG